MVITIEDAHLVGFIWCLIIESFQGIVQHVNRLEANNKRNSVCKSALKWIILVTLENIFFHKLGFLSLYGFRIDRNQVSYYVPLHGICWKQCLEFNLTFNVNILRKASRFGTRFMLLISFKLSGRFYFSC